MTGGRPHLLHVFSTFVPAGPQVRTAGLIEDTAGEFRHTALALDGRTEARELVSAAAGLRILEAPPKAGTLATFARMRRLLAEAAPDLVLTYNFGAMDAALAASTLGQAFVHHEDGFRPDEAQRLKLRRAWYRRIALARARRVVVISETLRRIAVDAWRLPAERVLFVPNGIEPDRFPAADGNPELRAELGIPPDALTVGAVGHLRPEKNVPRLIEAAAALAPERDLHLIVLGEGPERERIAAASGVGGGALEGRVHLVGYRADPRDHYRAMDVFSISSDTEQMPIALLEAMACSLPVVATDVGDVRRVLPDEQGGLVTDVAEGAPGLSRSLAALAGDARLRRELGRANRRRVEEHFTRERMTRSYRDLYVASMGR